MDYMTNHDLIVEDLDSTSKKALQMYMTLGSLDKDIYKFIRKNKIPGEYLLRCFIFVKNKVDISWWQLINEVCKKDEHDIYMVGEVIEAYKEGVPPQSVMAYLPACRKAFEMSIARKELQPYKRDDTIDKLCKETEQMINQAVVERDELKKENAALQQNMQQERKQQIDALIPKLQNDSTYDLLQYENLQLKEELKTLTDALMDKIQENKQLQDLLRNRSNEVTDQKNSKQLKNHRMNSYRQRYSLAKYKRLSNVEQKQELVKYMIARNLPTQTVNLVNESIKQGIPKDLIYELLQSKFDINEITQFLNFFEED